MKAPITLAEIDAVEKFAELGDAIAVGVDDVDATPEVMGVMADVGLELENGSAHEEHTELMTDSTDAVLFFN